MNATPLVSVIIPCYNYGRFLSEALESILAQTYKNWECIIIDDGSTDNTRDIAKDYARKDNRFKYVYQSNSGVSSARNKALEIAKGKYVQLLDADDMLEQDKFMLQVTYLEENHGVDLVYSSMIFFKPMDEIAKLEARLLQNKKPVSGSGKVLLNGLLEDNIFLPGSTIARKTLYDDVGLFKKGIEGIEDWDYFYRAALLQKDFHHDDRKGTRLLSRRHDDNASDKRFIMWSHFIKARKSLMQETKILLVSNKDSGFSNLFLQDAYKKHLALLNRDSARFNMFYESLFEGMKNAFKHAYYSGKPYFAFYDAAYWVKKRFKAKGREQ